MAEFKLRRILRSLSVAAAILHTVALGAGADELSTFHAAIEDAASHNRFALGYLRSENVELAKLELDRLRASWSALAQRYGAKPPPPFLDRPKYTETLIDVPLKAVAADLMLQMGRLDLARNSLQAIRVSLRDMRRDSGVEVLADCVLDFNAAMAAMLTYDETPPDWSLSETATELNARAEAIAAVARRCDALAPEAVRSSAEFRRLIDGTAASLMFIPKVIANRDDDMLHRVLGELRAFDNLLSFRYG
jgi:hypothetical protein